MSAPEQLTRGKLAGRGGVNIATIRYYEKRGLLPQAPRTRSGYRVYDGDALRRLQFIRQAQVLGFTLEEIGELLSLRMQPGTTCADIRMRAKEKIVAIENKIQDLQRIRNALTGLAAACRGDGPTSECPILEALETERPQ
ncbi:MAG: heavy metal-responsive transcriptional regulator [Burkholderiales bacterium]